MKTLEDGSKIQENDNGTVIQICRDGTRIQTNAKGGARPRWLLVSRQGDAT